MALDEQLRTLIHDMIVRNGLGRHLDFALVDAEPDRVAIRLPFREEVTTFGDLIHGGSIGALVDAAATAAAWTGANLAKNPRGTTINYTLNFLEGARGEDLVANARVIRRGGTICVIDVDVHTTSGIHVSQALVTYKLSSG